jgi:hypothetical protein
VVADARAGLLVVRTAGRSRRFIAGGGLTSVNAARNDLIAIFSEDVDYDTPAQAADIMLAKLEERGLTVLPLQATPRMNKFWRRAIHSEGVTGPAAVWDAMVEGFVTAPAREAG